MFKLVSFAAVSTATYLGTLAVLPGGVPQSASPVLGSLLEKSVADNKVDQKLKLIYKDQFTTFVPLHKFSSAEVPAQDTEIAAKFARSLYLNPIMKAEQSLMALATTKPIVIKDGSGEVQCDSSDAYAQAVGKLKFAVGDRIGPFVVTERNGTEFILTKQYDENTSVKTWINVSTFTPVTNKNAGSSAQHTAVVKLMYGTVTQVDNSLTASLAMPVLHVVHSLYSKLLFGFALQNMCRSNA